ncbi:hypothetical protein [Afipia sp. GAS231]|uniref:hypothetical protein n=1 Tax=Afipia sp. GAS231 TaxID=1882747 RepID=UPI00087A133A|nr:hypothetical protein [Afipia sp. GAS231]SDN37307.1 hypothetical protein SAMN05444050_1399 [Afipia sp. GAS231]
MMMDSSERRSIWIAGTVGLAAALAYYAVGIIPTYEYRTDVSVGEYAVEDGFQTFEPVASTEQYVRDKVLVAPVPDDLKNLGVIQLRLEAIVTVVDTGRTVRILSVAEESRIERITAVHRFIADGILDRIKPRSEHTKVRLRNKLAAEEEVLKLASSSMPVFSEITSDAKKSEVKIQEMARHLADEIVRLDQIEGSPSSAGAGETMINMGMGLSRRGQLALSQRLGMVELPQLRADIARTYLSLGQTVTQSRRTIADLTGQLAVLREPAVTQFVVRSASSTKPGLVVVLVGLVAGLATYLIAFAIRKMRPD